MGFFNDIGSLLGDAMDIKNEIESTVQDASSAISDTKAEVSAIGGEVTTTLQDSLDSVRNEVTGSIDAVTRELP